MYHEVILDGVLYRQVVKARDDGMAYAIVRARIVGVVCGYVNKRALEENFSGGMQCIQHGAVVHEARQIWKYDSKFVLQEIAEYGMRDPSAAKLSCAMSEPFYVLEDCGILFCTDAARDQLINIPAQEKL